jgi:alpha-ribazole phosphatase
MQFYLIRHPKPLGVLGECYGRKNVLVAATEISAAATSVRQQLPPSVLQNTPIYTSPLSRCATLARAIAPRCLPVVDHDLIEMDFGSWEGLPWHAVPRDQLDRWCQDLLCYRPGDGENAHAVAKRWQNFVNRMSRRRCDTVVAVTHAGIIRTALAQATRRTLSEITQSPIEFASVHCLAVSDAQHTLVKCPRLRA